MFTPIETYIFDALKRLLYQYSNSPNFQGLLTAMIGPMQDIENALVPMNTQRYLPGAQGAQLDTIGAIIGLARPAGASDADYTVLLLVQIKLNTSQGQPEQVIQVFLLLTAVTFCFFVEGQNAEFLIESTYVPPSQAAVDALISALETIAPAGVRCDGVIAYDAAIPFAYDGNLPGSGYDDGTQTVGGKYAQLFEYLGLGFAYASEPIGTLTAPLACIDGEAVGYGTLADPLFGGAYLT